MPNLDQLFGPLIPPQIIALGPAFQPWERDFEPDSLSQLDTQTAPTLKQVMDEISSGWRIGRVLACDTVILWLVGHSGEIIFAIEELVLDSFPTGRPKHQKLPITTTMPKLGHPSLINCSVARIAGEIYYDTGDNPAMWRINNNSGRYGRHPSRLASHLTNVSAEFLKFGIIVHPHFIPR